MMLSLESIALRRRALGLTQTELANIAGVSQSYIAKLEANKIEPSYSKVRAIFDALESLEEGRETKVGEIMSRGLISIDGEKAVKDAVDLMNEHGFSQIPVMDDGRPVGSVTEKTIIDKLIGVDGEGHIAERRIFEIMDDPFPQVGEDAPVSLVANMLRVYHAVLVHSKDQITGIVTKADLMKIL
jgi:predicted transcriptional regulator